MKKLCSMFLIVFFILSLASPGNAQEQNIEYCWASVVDVINDAFQDNSTYWFVEEVQALFWLPDIFISQNLTEEDQNNNCVGSFISSSGNALIYLTYSEEDISLDTTFIALKQSGYDVNMISVNSIPAILFRNAENDALYLIFETQEGNAFQIMFTSYSDGNLSILYDMIISSILPLEEEAVSTNVVPSSNPVSKLISK